MRKRRAKNIGPQRRVAQKAVHGGKITTAKGMRVKANQKRVQQKAVPELTRIGSDGGYSYYKGKTRRKSRK